LPPAESSEATRVAMSQPPTDLFEEDTESDNPDDDQSSSEEYFPSDNDTDDDSDTDGEEAENNMSDIGKKDATTPNRTHIDTRARGRRGKNRD